MNSKATLILLTAVLVVFGFIHFVEQPIRKQQRLQASRAILADFDPATITSILIRPNGRDDIKVERSNQVWRLTQPISYPAEAERIEALLTNLAQLEWITRISDADLRSRPRGARSPMEEFGFLPPQASLYLEGKDISYRLLIGTNSTWDDQVYLQIPGDGNISLANGSFLKFIPIKRDFWRNLDLVNFTNMPFDTIKVSTGSKVFQVERDAENHLWRMKSPQARADTPKIEALLRQLQETNVADKFITDDPQADLEKYGWQGSPPAPALELSFQQRDTNVLFRLQFGADVPGATNAVYARLMGASNIVQTAKTPLRGWQVAYTNFLDRHLISVPPTLVDGIEVQGEDRFTLQQQTNGEWLVKAAESFPADAEEMSHLLASFTNLQVEFENLAAADLAAYGLTVPTLQYTLKSSFASSSPSNQVLAQIQFGTNQTGRVFERRTDELSVNTIGREEFDRLPHASWQMRDRRIWNFDSSNVVSITVHELCGVRKLLRDPLRQLTFAPGSQGFINDVALEETLHRLGELKAVYWTAVDDAHAEKYGFAEVAHEVTLTVKQGAQSETYTIQFGKPSPYAHPYAAIMRDGHRLIFEFPAPLYALVHKELGIPAMFRHP